jgi:hypothetical protein
MGLVNEHVVDPGFKVNQVVFFVAFTNRPLAIKFFWKITIADAPVSLFQLNLVDDMDRVISSVCIFS